MKSVCAKFHLLVSLALKLGLNFTLVLHQSPFALLLVVLFVVVGLSFKVFLLIKQYLSVSYLILLN